MDFKNFLVENDYAEEEKHIAVIKKRMEEDLMRCFKLAEKGPDYFDPKAATERIMQHLSTGLTVLQDLAGKRGYRAGYEKCSKGHPY